MEGMVKEFGASIGLLMAAFGLMIWLIRMVMTAHLKMVEAIISEAEERSIAERTERQDMRVAYTTTINNHLTSHNVSMEKLSSTIEKLQITICRMNGGKG